MTQPHIYDTIIIGGGPAGLSAGIYSGRSTLDTLIIEGDQIGGQVTTTSTVANYPAVETIDGTALVNKMQQQAKDFGVHFIHDEISTYDFNDTIKMVQGKQSRYYGRSIIIATGAKPRQVGFDGEQAFRGRGVAYCSTCDGELFSGLEVFVIGGGYAAAEEADYLTRFARHVTIVMRSNEFTCAPLTAARALDNPNISIWRNTEIQSVSGDNYLTSATFINNQTQETTTYHVQDGDNTFGIFVYVGTDPQTQIFDHDIALNDNGYIIADCHQQTNIPGVYAAGDVVEKPLRQIVTAAADGANAATSAELYVTEQKRKLNMTVKRQVPKKSTQHSEAAPKTALNQQQQVVPKHSGTWFSDEIIQQLQPILDRLTKNVTLYQFKNTSDKSHELSQFLQEFSQLNEHLHYDDVTLTQQIAEEHKIERTPHFVILDEHGEDTGIKFSGIPTGHELNSLILAVYNVAGPGQTIDSQLAERIKQLPVTKLAIGVSLTCHFCPDVVAACQHIAALNDNISAEMIDLQLFPEIREQRHIMSVPALMIDQNSDIVFGSQTLEDIVTAIETATVHA
ncbi:FAD-dependent oxidoreductase [Leuconostoc fallax]|uniref:Thioredoxin-disulfide reductase n=1 Tax=Leuconostoc fallax TaxID=1251 RepID=A0A4R5NA15_9LACO|nr:FAD-dependent oxidoreductase [Leuconostoc fallax]MBU7456214.1 FAD-dependent oxidoreductase [Leuconostoc fallax]TDG69039.1 hypothetical protein C5L23_001170 [Leuconostoc fallax]